MELLRQYSEWTVGWMIEELVFDFWQDGYFSLLHSVHPGYGSTQSLIQWILGAVLQDVQQLGHETQPHPVLEAKKEWSCTSTPMCPCGMVLKYTGKFTIFFNFTQI
jgi:hypothetical protein